MKILILLISLAHGAQSYIDTNASLSVAGTAQQIHATSSRMFACELFARKGNAGTIYVSPASSSATVSAGIELAAGESFKQESSRLPSNRISFQDANSWYFNGDNAGDEVLLHCDK